MAFKIINCPIFTFQRQSDCLDLPILRGGKLGPIQLAAHLKPAAQECIDKHYSQLRGDFVRRIVMMMVGEDDFESVGIPCRPTASEVHHERYEMDLFLPAEVFEVIFFTQQRFRRANFETANNFRATLYKCGEFPEL